MSDAQLDLERETGARLSTCERYRYRLWRRWNTRVKPVNFLMLNPSTADATVNDPTVTRCERFAQSWGFGGIEVTNLFAARSTDPAWLRRFADPVGPENDAAIIEAAAESAMVVCAWGEHGAYLGRGAAVLELIWTSLPHRLVRCLGQNRSGQPVHPLYQPGLAQPRPLVAGVPGA